MGTTSPSSVLLISALSLLHMHLAAAAHDLSQFMDDAGDYQLFGSYDLEEKTISFAVNVSTTGWVGFGISPNGQMPGSDVVIGWVENYCTPWDPASWHKMAAMPDDCERTATVALPTAASTGFISG